MTTNGDFDLPKLATQLGPLVAKPLVGMERAEIVLVCEAVLHSTNQRLLLTRAVGPELAEVLGIVDGVPF